MELLNNLIILENKLGHKREFMVDINARPVIVGNNFISLEHVMMVDKHTVREAKFEVYNDNTAFEVEVHFTRPVSLEDNRKALNDFTMDIQGIDEEDPNLPKINEVLTKLINYYLDNYFIDVVTDAADREVNDYETANDLAPYRK